MIAKCKICKGSGRVFEAVFDFSNTGRVCRACKGVENSLQNWLLG